MALPLTNAEVKDVFGGEPVKLLFHTGLKTRQGWCNREASQPPTLLSQKKRLAISPLLPRTSSFITIVQNSGEGYSLHKLQLQWDQSYTNISISIKETLTGEKDSQNPKKLFHLYCKVIPDFLSQRLSFWNHTLQRHSENSSCIF